MGGLYNARQALDVAEQVWQLRSVVSRDERDEQRQVRRLSQKTGIFWRFWAGDEIWAIERVQEDTTPKDEWQDSDQAPKGSHLFCKLILRP
jgi:hypothetical protein